GGRGAGAAHGRGGSRRGCALPLLLGQLALGEGNAGNLGELPKDFYEILTVGRYAGTTLKLPQVLNGAAADAASRAAPGERLGVDIEGGAALALVPRTTAAPLAAVLLEVVGRVGENVLGPESRQDVLIEEFNEIPVRAGLAIVGMGESVRGALLAAGVRNGHNTVASWARMGPSQG